MVGKQRAKRIVPRFGLVSLIVLALGAGALIPASASATEPIPHWIACTHQVGGAFANTECAKEGTPNEWESLRLKEGEKLSLTALGKPFFISGTVAAVKTTLNCGTEVLAASAENPTGGGSGTGKAEVKYINCKAEGTNVGTCSVTSTTNTTSKLELISVEGKTQVRVTPSEGSTFATFTFANSGGNCSLAGAAPRLTGTYQANFSNVLSQLEVSPATSAALRLGGQLATATGSVGLKTGAGGNLKAEPAGPPTNTSLPLISGTNPHQGTSDSAERGTWASHGEPISFSYQWLRCNSAGSGCISIEGATTAAYTPVEADVGHTLEFKVTAKNTSGESTATSNHTNVVAEPIATWRRCAKVAEGTGAYSDPGCNVAGGSKAFAKVSIFEKEPFTFGDLSPNPEGPIIEWKLSGVEIKEECSSWSGKGSLNNLANGPGISKVQLILTGCKVNGPSGCTVKSPGAKTGEIRSSPLAGFPLADVGNPPIKLVSEEANLWTWTYEGSTCALNNGSSFSANGYFEVQVENNRSVLTFLNGETATAKVGSGGAYRLFGATKIATTAGEALSVAP